MFLRHNRVHRRPAQVPARQIPEMGREDEHVILSLVEELVHWRAAEMIDR